jgi:hypothetical protein
MVSAKLLCAVVAAITLLSALPSAAAPAHQEVIELPGLTADLNFKHYAGYVDATPGERDITCCVLLLFVRVRTDSRERHHTFLLLSFKRALATFSLTRSHFVQHA